MWGLGGAIEGWWMGAGLDGSGHGGQPLARLALDAFNSAGQHQTQLTSLRGSTFVRGSQPGSSLRALPECAEASALPRLPAHSSSRANEVGLPAFGRVATAQAPATAAAQGLERGPSRDGARSRAGGSALGTSRRPAPPTRARAKTDWPGQPQSATMAGTVPNGSKSSKVVRVVILALIVDLLAFTIP